MLLFFSFIIEIIIKIIDEILISIFITFDIMKIFNILSIIFYYTNKIHEVI